MLQPDSIQSAIVCARIRVPVTTGSADIFPGTRSTRSQSIQKSSIAASVSRLARFAGCFNSLEVRAHLGGLQTGEARIGGLLRMFGHKGSPSAANLSAILTAPKKTQGVRFELSLRR
ncbi:MAG: hypothetical protein ACRD3W_15350 [Terriglobales bacterium]